MNYKQMNFVLWLTGISGAGKTTISQLLINTLAQTGVECEHLDGDAFRKAVTPHLGYSREERQQNVKSAGFLANALAKHGIPVVCSFVSPSRESREELRQMCDNFVEVFVDAPLETVMRRDPKGLYKQNVNLAGVSGMYEPPTRPDIHVRTDQQTVAESVQAIVDGLMARGLIMMPQNVPSTR
ncbi:MAG: adenylyl-sulfate kinase [Chloroflexota bacterium]